MSEKPVNKDILRTVPEPKRIGLGLGQGVVTGDRANPALVINISMAITPELIEQSVRNALSSGVDKAVVLRYLYRLVDVAEKLIEELEGK